MLWSWVKKFVKVLGDGMLRGILNSWDENLRWIKMLDCFISCKRGNRERLSCWWVL